jgi:phage shock protein E
MKAKLSLLLAASLCISPGLVAVGQTAASLTKPATIVKGVGVEEFANLRTNKTSVVLDVRTAGEFKAGHIPGALNIDLNSADFDKKVGELDKSKTYLVHCAAGVRSAKACSKLESLGFKQLVDLRSGFRAWQEAGKPVEK